MLYASLAILARRIPFALTAALFLCLLAFDMVQTLSLMFGLAPTEMMAALDQARRIHFFASPLYLSLIAVMLTTTLAALACLSQRSALVHGRASILFVLALAFGALDYASTVSPHYRFGSTFGRDKPVESAAEVSGFSLAAGAGREESFDRPSSKQFSIHLTRPGPKLLTRCVHLPSRCIFRSDW